MTQKMPPYLDKRYPPQAFIRETKNAAHEVKKRRDAHFWNETEEKFHDWYVDMEKYKTMDAAMAAPPAGSKQGSLDKLTVSRRLKEFLYSNLMLSDANTDEYCKQV